MANLNIFCVIEGETTSFPVEIESTKTVGHLKDAIKAKKSNYFEKIDADDLTLWRVSIPILPKKDRKAISLADVSSKEELDEATKLSNIFDAELPEETIHIIVQPPQSGNATHYSMQAFRRALFSSTVVTVINTFLSPFSFR